MTSMPSTSIARAQRAPVKPFVASSPYWATMSSCVQSIAFWNWP
ncbi:MAG: hypothetical protein R3E53_15940 [Myxococcota bacterium]